MAFKRKCSAVLRSYPPEPRGREHGLNAGKAGAYFGTEAAVSGGLWWMAKNERDAAYEEMKKNPNEFTIARWQRAQDMMAGAETLARAGISGMVTAPIKASGAVTRQSAMCRGRGAAELESFCRACLSYLDNSLYDTLFDSSKRTYLRHFHSSIPRGVQLGQVAIYCRVSTDDQCCERQERDLRAFAKRAGHRIVGVFKETASGAKNDRPERKKVMALAQAREIDAIIVTELSRWGRSTQDLVQTLDDLHGWKVSVLAQTGLSFDLSTASGKLMRTIMAGLAEFERDLIRDRVKSGLAAASARGVLLGRQVGQRPSDKKAKKALAQHKEGLSYRLIGRNLGLSKNTVMEIIKREAS